MTIVLSINRDNLKWMKSQRGGNVTTVPVRHKVAIPQPIHHFNSATITCQIVIIRAFEPNQFRQMSPMFSQQGTMGTFVNCLNQFC